MITDVIYSSKESSNDEVTTTGSKEELERIKVWSGVLYEVCLCTMLSHFLQVIQGYLATYTYLYSVEPSYSLA